VENLVINSNFWKGKKVLLTGHTGFKGSWLSLWLQKLGVNLTGFSLSIPTNPSLFKSAKIEKGMNSVFGDIRNYEQLNKVVRQTKPQIVIHMAAQAILPKSYDEPLQTYSTNVMGTVNLLESIRHNKTTKVVLVITSDKCYEPHSINRGYKEQDPLGGYDPYSSSKGCAEIVTSSYRTSFFNTKKYSNHKIAVASARAGNVIGGGDWAKTRLIPDIMSGILTGKKIKIRNQYSIRPWQFVLDPLNGYLFLIEKLWHNGPKFSDAWNFGPSNRNLKSVKWILDTLQKYRSNSINWEKDNNFRHHEEKSLVLNSSKAKSKLGWKPKLNLENSLKWTSDWYRENQKNKNIRSFTQNQIENFMFLNN